MIISLLINLVLVVFVALFSFLPVVTLADLPYGESIRSILITGVQYWNSFLITFPYAETAWDIFLKIVIPFEVLLLLSKFFLGSRHPSHSVN